MDVVELVIYAGCVGPAFVVRSVPAATDQISSVPIQTVKQHQPAVAIPARRLQGFQLRY